MTEQNYEQKLGLSEWAVESEGIGGILKTRFEDFRVEEESKIPALDSRGRFTVAKVTLTNWETTRFLRKLSSACKINRNRIYSAGLKDKRAVTTQILVIDAPIKVVERIQIPDSVIEIIGRTHHKVSMGDHEGNRFTITVRGCCDVNGNPIDAKEAIKRSLKIKDELIERMGGKYFPNWIGPQRFGSIRPVTPEVGRALVNGDVEKAVNTYIGMPSKWEDESSTIFRKKWIDTKNPSKCLELAPDRLGYEKAMLKHLDKKENDYLGAFKTMPNSLQLLMIHSIQSLVFNHSLRIRLKNNISITEPEIGDIVAPIQQSGKIDIGKMADVSETNLERCRRNCQLGRLIVTGPLPGSKAKYAEALPGECELEARKVTNLEDCNWIVPEIPRLTTSGTRRQLSVPFRDFNVAQAPDYSSDMSERWDKGPQEGDRWHPEGASIRFRFTLPPGTYATIFLREFMHSPLNHY